MFRVFCHRLNSHGLCAIRKILNDKIYGKKDVKILYTLDFLQVIAKWQQEEQSVAICVHAIEPHTQQRSLRIS